MKQANGAVSIFGVALQRKITNPAAGSDPIDLSVEENRDAIRDELSRMADVGPTQEDLDNAKKYLTGSYPLRFDTNSKIASQMLGILVEDMGINYVKDRNKMIEVVTLEDLRRAAKRFLNVSDLIVTVVGKPKGMGPRG